MVAGRQEKGGRGAVERQGRLGSWVAGQALDGGAAAGWLTGSRGELQSGAGTSAFVLGTDVPPSYCQGFSRRFPGRRHQRW